MRFEEPDERDTGGMKAIPNTMWHERDLRRRKPLSDAFWSLRGGLDFPGYFQIQRLHDTRAH
jgi:hypothetical protein